MKKQLIDLEGKTEGNEPLGNPILVSFSGTPEHSDDNFFLAMPEIGKHAPPQATGFCRSRPIRYEFWRTHSEYYLAVQYYQLKH